MAEQEEQLEHMIKGDLLNLQPAPVQPHRYSRCLGNRDNQGTFPPRASDFVLYTELGAPTGKQ
jgi:hypothetical protein